MKRALSSAAGVLLVTFGLFASSPAMAATASQQVFWTFYGWYDNTPPGGDIAYPRLLFLL